MSFAVRGVASLCGYPLFPVLCYAVTKGHDVINYLRGMAATGTVCVCMYIAC